MNRSLVVRYLLGFLMWLTVTPAFAEATSTEIEFWQSVKESDDADMFRAYLEEFPDGKFKSLAKIKIKKLTGGGEEVTTSSTSAEAIDKIINLSGYWQVEHAIGSSTGAVEPYTLIVQLEQDGNSVSSVTVVEFQTSGSISCNGNGGPFAVNGTINGDAFAGTMRSANLDGRFSLTGDHKELKGTYNSRWLEGICAGQMSGLITARKLSDDTGHQLIASLRNIGIETDKNSVESESGTYSSSTESNKINQRQNRCFDSFNGKNLYMHEGSARNWEQVVEQYHRSSGVGAHYSDLILECREFLSNDLLTWIASDSTELSVSNNLADKNQKECFDLFNGKDVQIGTKTFRNWEAVVAYGTDYGGVREEIAGLLVQCDPFLSEDNLTWIGQYADDEEKIETSSQNFSSSEWCVKRSGVEKLGFSNCVARHGIPMLSRSGWMTDRALWYFESGKKNKAFAVGSDMVASSSGWDSVPDAIERALWDCYIFSLDSSSCRVVNINNNHEDHKNNVAADNPAFGEAGPVEELSGTYYLNMDLQGIDGRLKVEVNQGRLNATLQTCIEGICDRWKSDPDTNPWINGGRRVQFKMIRMAGRGWSVDELNLNIAFSKSTRHVAGVLGIYKITGTKSQ
jgi:hypothetical protein